MRSFSYTYWLVVPKGASANSRLAEYFNQFADDRLEEHVRCQNGSGTITQSGWRADSFAAELKPVLRSFTKLRSTAARLGRRRPCPGAAASCGTCRGGRVTRSLAAANRSSASARPSIEDGLLLSRPFG
jgi:hypothetical protein